MLANFDIAPTSGTVWLGLEHQPSPGWHVYWKNAGDAGYAPRLKWTGSRGIDTPALLWPAPTKFILPGDLVAYGYEQEVVYPIEVHIQPGATSIHLLLDLDYLTCSEPCVPYRYTLVLDIPIGRVQKSDPKAQALIEQFRAQVPSAAFSDEQVQNQARVERIGTAADHPSTQAPGIVAMFLLALLGGFILNAMPCVLPVLSIKLLSLLQHSGQARGAITRNALATGMGIITSFLSLGLVAVVLKRAGHAVGWGTQFQNPVFVGVLGVIVMFFALNMWGLFEIPLPQFLGRMARTQEDQDTVVSSFLSGLFVTLLATPCSAPFLGTAMGFALAQSGATILTVFGAAGFGMAMPYWLLTIFPRSVHWLPRPGAWMNRLKVFLGTLLMATAVWLGWVIVQQVHPTAHTPARGELPWIPFNAAVLARDLAEGKTVFVDITADWCFTCKYNERVVLNAPKIMAAFKNQKIELMQGDWTQRDAAIAQFLTHYGRAGIPFAGLYRPGKEPVLLPEFLTERIVLKALAN